MPEMILSGMECSAELHDNDDGFQDPRADPRAKYDDLRSFDAQWTPDDLDNFAAWFAAWIASETCPGSLWCEIDLDL